jgi:CHAT domain-containing protein
LTTAIEFELGWLGIAPHPAEFDERVDRADELVRQYWYDSEPDAANRLVALWQDVVSDPRFAGTGVEFQATVRDRLALALGWLAVPSGSVSGLDSADDELRRAMQLVLGSPRRLELDYHQGILLYNRHLVTSSPPVLEAAIETLQRAVDALPSTDRRLQPRCLELLARCLLARHYRLGRSGDLSEATTDAQLALDRFTSDAPYRVFAEHTLARALLDRYKAGGGVEHLDRAAAQLELLLAHVQYRGLDVAARTLLGIICRERFMLARRPQDVDDAVRWHDSAIARAGPGVAQPALLTNLGNALLDRYHHVGDVADLERAATVHQESVNATRPDDDMYPSRLNNLANSRSTLFDATGDRAQLDSAIALTTEAIRLAPESRDLASRRYNLGNLLRARHALTSSRRDRRDAVDSYRIACTEGLESAVEWALAGSRVWGDWASERAAWREAAEAYEYGSGALERLFANQAAREHRETWLEHAQGLPARAAYAHARCHHYEAAVCTQEGGRALLLADAMERVDQEDHRRPDLDAILRAASGTRLVYLSAADRGGVALEVGARVRPVWLPDLTDAAARARAELLLRADSSRSSDPGRWLGALDAVARWAYDAVMGPLLDQVRGADSLTIVAAGRLGQLPLHAAWEPASDAVTGRRYALDAVALTYVPNARARAAALASTTAAKALVVDQPAPVSAAPLALSATEAAIVSAHVPSATVLAGNRASRDSVLDTIAHHPLVHLSCHGRGRPDRPLDSGLLMADDVTLTLRDLLALMVSRSAVRPRMAVLSACETDRPGIELPDEAVSLPTGLLQAGFAGVVATQWKVSGLASAMLMVHFYEAWLREGQAPGQALRSAQQWLRDTTCGDQAAYFHPATAPERLGLPAGAVRPLWYAALRRPRAERRFSHPSEWAAFAHVGV